MNKEHFNKKLFNKIKQRCNNCNINSMETTKFSLEPRKILSEDSISINSLCKEL